MGNFFGISPFCAAVSNEHIVSSFPPSVSHIFYMVALQVRPLACASRISGLIRLSALRTAPATRTYRSSVTHDDRRAHDRRKAPALARSDFGAATSRRGRSTIVERRTGCPLKNLK
jgi:hypothetical protein